MSGGGGVTACQRSRGPRLRVAATVPCERSSAAALRCRVFPGASHPRAEVPAAGRDYPWLTLALPCAAFRLFFPLFASVVAAPVSPRGAPVVQLRPPPWTCQTMSGRAACLVAATASPMRLPTRTAVAGGSRVAAVGVAARPPWTMGRTRLGADGDAAVVMVVTGAAVAAAATGVMAASLPAPAATAAGGVAAWVVAAAAAAVVAAAAAGA